MSTSVLAQSPPTQSQISGNWPNDFLLTIPASAHTFDGFRAWIPTLPEKTRVTFFAGEVLLDMSNEDIQLHVAVKGEIFATLYQLNKEIRFGQLYLDGGLLTNVDAEVSNNPDAVAVSWKTIDDGRFRIVTKDARFSEMDGSPDWVLEVVSPSSVTKEPRNNNLVKIVLCRAPFCA